jgi:hypothetical protein
MKNVLVMVEEFFSFIPIIDVTQTMLVEKTYAASYNVPYNQAIADVANYPAGDTYTGDPRAQLFG